MKLSTPGGHRGRHGLPSGSVAVSPVHLPGEDEVVLAGDVEHDVVDAVDPEAAVAEDLPGLRAGEGALDASADLFPSSAVTIALPERGSRNSDKARTGNDLLDAGTVSSVIPYCDGVTTEFPEKSHAPVPVNPYCTQISSVLGLRQ